LDLGYRLFKTGAAFVFSRFAIGHHIVDANEPAPRNPFRARKPERAHFVGYEKNLVTLASLHPNDPAIERFVAQARADIDETCGRPDTVGIEMGGTCAVEDAFHRTLHRLQPGGVSTYELLDRLAYAIKVGARALYLVGGEPASHPGFFELLHAAKAAGIHRITTETTALPFAEPGIAERARAAGLERAVIEVLSFDEKAYDAVTQSHGRFASFLSGIDRLREAGIACSARLVAPSGPSKDAAIAEIRAHGLGLEAVVDWPTA
jgi:hypothetical protein